MSLSQLKLEIDQKIDVLARVMSEIQRLDMLVQESDNPDTATTMVDVILKRGQEFEQTTAELKLMLESYTSEQKKSGLAVDFSYLKLLQQIDRTN